METKGLLIKVVSTDGSPLAGATVIPVGMRSREEPGSCYGWGPRSIPGVNGGTSDTSGTTTISFPAHPMDNLTTGTVIVRVEHPEACGAQVEVNVEAPRPITLVRGTCVRFSAQAIPGVVLAELYADLEHDDRQAGRLKWERQPDGLSITSYLPNGKYSARLIGFTGNGKIYFGEPMLLVMPPSDGSEMNLTWSLREGSSMKGTLGTEVPRPIKSGWVVALVTSPKRVENACGVLANRWEVSAMVAADGSFVLADLPEGTLEIVAGCKGFVAKDLEDRSSHGVHFAQVMPEDRDLPVELPMEATGAARVVVLSPAGQPLADAAISFCPNQSLGRHTSIIGSKFDSANLLRARKEGALDALRPTREIPRFWAKTGADGVAIILGLPPGQQTFFVMAEGYDLPILEEQRPLGRGEIRMPRRQGMIAIRPDEETTAQVRLEPKGSTSLSAAIEAARQTRRRCG